MKRKLAAVLAAVALAVTSLLAPSAAVADEAGPGMCSGPGVVSTGINAHANGGTGPKYILNISTDEFGTPAGTLVLGQGKMRLEVTEWCRVWMHVPGTTGSGEEDIPEGATVAHAVGFARIGGALVQVRTDVRSTEDGMAFRVRYRDVIADSDHGTVTAPEEDDWTSVPAEGWAPLSQLILHVPAPTG